MKRQDYVKHHAIELKKMCDKRDKLHEKTISGELSYSQFQKVSAELNFLSMHIEQTKERIAFGLGYLIPENTISEYRPSGFHRYDGIRRELERTKFDK
ncbi:MAG: hypothetical protein EPN37_07105 [Chitinophagaceae bacterium]|nr:MAG: hypothetical protein EPN37_07105 [Chitinophagaceae bacterium]